MKTRTQIVKTVHNSYTLPNGQIATTSYSVKENGERGASHDSLHEKSDWEMIFVRPASLAEVQVLVTLDSKVIFSNR